MSRLAPSQAARLIVLAAVCAYGEPSPSITSVTLSGHLGLKESEVRKSLRATRTKVMLPRIPGIWTGWRVLPAYSKEAVQSDVGNVRSLYYQRGFLDADVKVESVRVEGKDARVALAVESGPHYEVREFDGRSVWPPRHAGRPTEAACRELLQQRREAERLGILDFSPTLEVHDNAPGWVDLTSAVQSGPAYRTGRIEFRGNHSFRDGTLRRMLLLDEQAPFDQTVLRRSLARINKTGWFEPLQQGDVVVHTAADSDHADVTIRLKETKPRQWYFSGPAGPMKIGGSLHFTLGSRLPRWGKGILELSTYSVSANLFLFAKPIGTLIPFLPNRRFLRVVTIQRSLIPGQPLLSGLTLAPQFGWIGVAGSYGVAQARRLVQELGETERRFTPDLAVTVRHENRSGTLLCQPSATRAEHVREVSAMAGNVLLSFAPF